MCIIDLFAILDGNSNIWMEVTNLPIVALPEPTEEALRWVAEIDAMFGIVR